MRTSILEKLFPLEDLFPTKSGLFYFAAQVFRILFLPFWVLFATCEWIGDRLPEKVKEYLECL